VQIRPDRFCLVQNFDICRQHFDLRNLNKTPCIVGLQLAFFFLTHFVMELRWKSSLKWFSQIGRFKNWKLNFCCFFYIFRDLQELSVWWFFILFLNFVKILPLEFKPKEPKFRHLAKKIAANQWFNLPTSLWCRQSGDDRFSRIWL